MIKQIIYFGAEKILFLRKNKMKYSPIEEKE
jgi:hypothetical protein